MNQKHSVFSLFPNLWIYIPSKRKLQFKLLLLLSFFTTLIEMLSIGLAIPFISVLIEPEKIYNHKLFHDIFQDIGFVIASQIILPVTIFFGVTIILSMLMRVILLWSNSKLAFSTGIDVSIELYNKILHQSYLFHTKKNSSEIINIVNIKVSEVIFYIIMPSLTLITSGIMALFMALLLIYFLPFTVIWVILVFVIMYVFAIKILKNKLKNNSEIISYESTQIIKTLQEGLGGIRDIIIDKTHKQFSKDYEKSVRNLRNIQAENQIFGGVPKFILEGVGMLFVAFFAYTMSSETNDSQIVIPMLVGIVLTIQRLLPLMQQMFYAWSQIQSAQASLKDVVEYLNLKIPENLNEENNKSAIRFNKAIKLHNINFQYSSSTPAVLKSIDLDISKGSRIGFIGSTGSGKSTLLDIMMGLLEPSSGSISIDGTILSKENMHLWQKLIAHVPQSIYLIDSTIEQNIAFGIEEDKIDQELVRSSAQKAQIADVIETMPKGYKTIIGERGVQLSGGQRQRLGIARALYKEAQVIILDEATSALDNETEKAVIESFEAIGDDVTLLMIAHRITTLKNCTNIVEIKEGNIHRIVKYEELKDHDGRA